MQSRNTTYVFLGVLALLVILALNRHSEPHSSSDVHAQSAVQAPVVPSVSQKGYFQDSRRNRVFTLEMPAGMTSEQARAHAENLPYTQGQVTGAYYYRPGAQLPIDGVTLANDFLAATQVLDTPGLSRFSFAYVRGFNGQAAFADCETTPKNDLCVSTH